MSTVNSPAEAAVLGANTIEVNGSVHEFGHLAGPLLSYLRGELALTGVKPGCGEGECGACTVLVDGQPELSCQVELADVVGRSVTTIEGLAIGNSLHPMQQALIEAAASQCGYCTPGMALRGAALLADNPDPNDTEIAAALDPNLCRCGCYVRIVQAVRRASELSRKSARYCVTASRSFEPPALGRPRRPWDLCEPHERDYFAILGDGLVAVWPPPTSAPGIAARGGGAWVHIAASGSVTAFTGKVDVGQDNTTAFRLLVAEELAAPLEAVRVVTGDTDLSPFDIGTFGSRSMPDAGESLRRAAAGARELLCALAADRWHDEQGGLLANEGAVHGHSAGASLEYGDLVTGLQWIAVIDHEPELRAGYATHLVGNEGHLASRLDAVTGQRRFVSDLDLPGMAHGAVLRPPVRGSTLRSVYSGAQPPSTFIVRDGSFVGAVATSPLAARRVLEGIEAVWDPPTEEPDDVAAYLRSHPVVGVGWERPVDEAIGDVEEVIAGAAISLEATYSTAYIAHVPMETRAALAQFDAGRLTVWVGTQVPFGIRAQLADAIGLDEANVRVVVPPTGGGFGGKHGGDVAIEAARLARATNRPVKVHWSRGEEFQFGYLRPMAIIDVRAGLDQNGAISAWDFLDVNAGSAGLTPPYLTRTRRLRFQPAESPLAQGSYRALGATANNFARESLIDELANELGVDPLEFRLANLDDDRLGTVLHAAADRLGWPIPQTAEHALATGRGLAVGLEKGGRVATCAEVTVRGNRVTVSRIVTAYECGRVVNRDAVVNQIEGATVMALGGALFEKIAPSAGRLAQLPLSAYRVPRFTDLPNIEVVLIDRPDLPSAGAGETPMIAVAPAIANAIFRATGSRIRSLPLT